MATTEEQEQRVVAFLGGAGRRLGVRHVLAPVPRGLAAAGVDEELYAHATEWPTWPGYSEQERLAAEFELLLTRLRDDEYLLYDNDTNQLVLGSRSGRHTTGVSLEQVRLYLEEIRRWS